MSLWRKRASIAGVSFLFVLGGGLIVAALTIQGCPSSPGYVGNHVCLACHDGRTAPDKTEFLKSAHNAAGVQCEDCHGPGLLHVQNGGRAGLFIQNPANFSFEDLIELCAKCHATEANTFKQSVHANKQAARCTTCHDPHSPDITQLPADDNQLCLSCHASMGFASDAAITAHTFHTVDPAGTGASRCIGCHMPPLQRLNQDAGPHDHSVETIPPIKSNEAIAAGITPTPPNSCAGITGCHDGTVPTAPVFNVDDPAQNELLQEIYDQRYGTEEPED